MTERALISSNRLDKLEDLTEAVRRHAGNKFYDDETDLITCAAADAMLALIELEGLSHSLLQDVATQYKIRLEA
jgi:transcriptional regulator GlxA family with amidase domain